MQKKLYLYESQNSLSDLMSCMTMAKMYTFWFCKLVYQVCIVNLVEGDMNGTVYYIAHRSIEEKYVCVIVCICVYILIPGWVQY